MEAERRLARLLIAEQTILDGIFPRHVIDALTRAEAEADQAAEERDGEGEEGGGGGAPESGGGGGCTRRQQQQQQEASLLAKLRSVQVATAHEEVRAPRSASTAAAAAAAVCVCWGGGGHACMHGANTMQRQLLLASCTGWSAQLHAADCVAAVLAVEAGHCEGTRPLERAGMATGVAGCLS